MARQDKNSEATPTASEPLIVLKENRLAHTALTKVVQSGGGAWLVYLYGPSGVGKSHLVRTGLRELRRSLPQLRVQQLATSEFVAECEAASSRDEKAEFHARNAAIDLLVLEDIAAIQGRSATQQSLVALFDDLKRSGGRVIVTGSCLPGQLKRVMPRLVSRLRGGICVPIELLDESSRLSFASSVAGRRQIPLSREAVAILAKEGPATPRELIAALLSLEMTSRKNGREPQASLLRAHLHAAHRSRGESSQEHSLSRIAKAVAKSFGIPMTQLRSRLRHERLAIPRQIGMLLAKELSGEPAAAIAKFFGRKNHTTVVHACRRARVLLANDPALARMAERLRQTLRRH